MTLKQMQAYLQPRVLKNNRVLAHPNSNYFPQENQSNFHDQKVTYQNHSENELSINKQQDETFTKTIISTHLKDLLDKRLLFQTMLQNTFTSIQKLEKTHKKILQKFDMKIKLLKSLPKI